MKTQTSVMVLSLVFLISACGGNDLNNNVKSGSETDSVQAKQKPTESADKAAKTPILNKGLKWQANPETTLGIQKMMLLVTAQLNSEVSDLSILGENLDQEFNNILKQCTMTGEAHDQLHNYLLPLKTKIDQLKKELNTENAADIQSYLGTYTDYFQ